MPAREVDQVGLADRLERRAVVAVRGGPDEHRLDLRAERREVLDAHLRPGEERLLAVDRGGGRKDRDARPGSAGRLEEPSIEFGHGGEELSGADERHGTGHGGSIRPRPIRGGRARPGAALDAPRRPCNTRPRMKTFERWTMVAAILGTSMVFLDGTIMNLALPRVGEELPGTIFSRLEGQTYAVSGYLAILAALLILAGALGDYYGRRRIFAIGLTGFGITSVLCGLAPTLELLVVARLLQGAAGALLVPGSLAILTALFEGPARARAIGIWASATSATTLLGPVIGGLLVDGVSWRAAFLINVPLVAIALFATIRYMPETRSEEATGHVRLARRGRRRDRGRRARVRGDPRHRPQLAGPGRVGLARHRRHRAHRLPVPHGAPAEPARAAGPVPPPALRDDQPLDAPDLRRPVHRALHPGPVPAGRRRLHGDRGRADRRADRDHAHAALGADRDARRSPRRPPVPRRRADPHGARPAVARARPGRHGARGSSRSPTRRPTCRRHRR